MKHLLGTRSGLMAEPNEDDKPEEIKWREDTVGKLDLLVSLDFRMTATPLYSDIVLQQLGMKNMTYLQPTCIHLFIHLIQQLIHYGSHVLTGTFTKH